MQADLGTGGLVKLADGDRMGTVLIQECEELVLSPSLASSQLWKLAQVSYTS